MLPHSFERIDLPELGTQRMYGFRGWDHCVARQILPILNVHGHPSLKDEDQVMNWRQQTNAEVYWLTSNLYSAYIDTAVAWYEQPGGIPDLESFRSHGYDDVKLPQVDILEMSVRRVMRQKLAALSINLSRIA